MPTLIFKLLKRTNHRSTSGISLLEVVVSVAVTVSITLGVGMVLRASYSSFTYQSDQAKKVKDNQILINTLTADFSGANVFYVSSPAASDGTTQPNISSMCSTWDSTDTTYATVRPLFTVGVNTVDLVNSLSQLTYVGYELRLAPDDLTGELWRIPCGTLGAQPNLEQQSLLNDNLAKPSNLVWGYTNSTWAIQCNQVLDPTNTSTTTSFAKCPADVAIITTMEAGTTSATPSPSPTSTTSTTTTSTSSQGSTRGIIFRLFDKKGIELTRVLSSRSML